MTKWTEVFLERFAMRLQPAFWAEGPWFGEKTRVFVMKSRRKADWCLEFCRQYHNWLLQNLRLWNAPLQVSAIAYTADHWKNLFLGVLIPPHEPFLSPR